MEGLLRAFKIAVAAALLFAAAACTGGVFDESTVQRFTPGVTTRAEAIAALGAPSSVYQAANGETTLSWASGGGLFNPGETRQFAAVFGADDKMIRIVAAPPK
jgi:hypothetical protein